MRKFILLFLFLGACSIVGPGERGVRVSLGKADQETLQSGAYLWIPFIYGLKTLDVQVQKSDIHTSSASKDMQEITTTVAVNWSLDPQDVVTVYKQVGDEDEIYRRILEPAVNEVMKAASSKRTAEEILTKRLELKKDIDDGLKQRLEPYKVKMMDVSIVNLAFSKDFTQAIEEKQIAEQQAKQAEYTALKATQDAKATVEQAKGQAAAQNLVRATLTKEILQQRAIEKWDGKFPQVMGSGTLPFINLKDLNKGE